MKKQHCSHIINHYNNLINNNQHKVSNYSDATFIFVAVVDSLGVSMFDCPFPPFVFNF